MPTIWVVSGDPSLRQKWGPEFEKESWQAAFLEDIQKLAGVAKAGGVTPGSVALIEADLLAGQSKAMAAVRGARVPYLLFGRGENWGDSAIIRQLDAGADDFFDPSQEPRVLVAKLKAHIRRLSTTAAEPMESPRGMLRIDAATRTAWRKAKGDAWSELPRLTAKEFALLALFIRRPGEPLQRRDILEQVWGDPAEEVNPETVDKHVGSLRRKLGPASASIRTLHGLGYTFQE